MDVKESACTAEVYRARIGRNVFRRIVLERFTRCEGRTIWIVDAHRGDGQRFVVHADNKSTAFLELERSICLHILSEQNKADCVAGPGTGNA